MKKIVLVVMVACALCTELSAQLRTPQASPTQTIKQNFGLSDIEISYSRPGMRGRKIFGDLVPFGNVWRTGANQATTVTFGEEVTIGGKKVPAGKYGLLSIPAKDTWTVILSSQVNVTSPDAYKNDSDIVRVTAKPTSLRDPVETFTIQVANIKPNSCDINMMWGNTSVSLPVKVDVDAKVMAQIDQSMSSDKPAYFEAASYYFDNGKDIKKAKEWVQKAVDDNPKAFWVAHLMAKIHAKSGDKAGAIAAAKKSIELAKEAKNNDYVALNEKLLTTLK